MKYNIKLNTRKWNITYKNVIFHFLVLNQDQQDMVAGEGGATDPTHKNIYSSATIF